MYEKFKELDGSHPWRDVSPDGFVDYQARMRSQGRVLYFNFPLAREIELIPEDHPSVINKELEQAILETFALRIINEHDLKTGKKYPPETIKARPYMATRYLQTQHHNKQGKTSGDGRSIWNGYLKTSHLTFDISSRGTGATILSPGAQKSDGAVKTGDESFGYSSGLADLEEMLGSAVMSEIFYRQDIPTERCLAVIGFPDGAAIGVRSAPNLIRPAHIFRYLKQNRQAELKAAVDYFIQRQIENGFWQFPDAASERYATALITGPVLRPNGRSAEEEYISIGPDGDNISQPAPSSITDPSDSLPRSMTSSLQGCRSLPASGTAGWRASWCRCLRRRWVSSKRAKRRTATLCDAKCLRAFDQLRRKEIAACLANRFYCGTDRTADAKCAKGNQSLHRALRAI
jgi:hypothetical protein